MEYYAVTISRRQSHASCCIVTTIRVSEEKSLFHQLATRRFTRHALSHKPHLKDTCLATAMSPFVEWHNTLSSLVVHGHHRALVENGRIDDIFAALSSLIVCSIAFSFIITFISQPSHVSI